MIRRADLHVHTRFSRWSHLKLCNAHDSYNDPLEVFHRCRELGMDFVALTDHDTIDGAIDLLSRHPELEPRLIVGEEVEATFPDSGQWVHVNVFGIDEEAHREIQRLKPDVRELVRYLRSRGFLHALNHPFQSCKVQAPAEDYLDSILELFDHFETRNAALSPRHNEAVSAMIRRAGALGIRKHQVGGSDAHVMRHLTACWTEAPDGSADPSNPDQRSFLQAVVNGDGRAAGHSIGAAALAANVYSIIGRYYLEFARREGRRGMTAVNYASAAVLLPVVVAGLPLFLSLGNSLLVEAVTIQVRRALRRLPSAEPGRQVIADLLEDLPD